ncbi:hypothetical protein TNCV_2473121 [Trichonephila clavipes]|nr:hypothetical protein TNCV_2473121 [Trichonephila clavipes]
MSHKRRMKVRLRLHVRFEREWSSVAKSPLAEQCDASFNSLTHQGLENANNYNNATPVYKFSSHMHLTPLETRLTPCNNERKSTKWPTWSQTPLSELPLEGHCSH